MREECKCDAKSASDPRLPVVNDIERRGRRITLKRASRHRVENAGPFAISGWGLFGKTLTAITVEFSRSGELLSTKVKAWLHTNRVDDVLDTSSAILVVQASEQAKYCELLYSYPIIQNPLGPPTDGPISPMGADSVA